MANYKTTIMGFLAAFAAILTDVLQKGASLEDWKTWLLPVCLAALGIVAKDWNVTNASYPVPPRAVEIDEKTNLPK